MPSELLPAGGVLVLLLKVTLVLALALAWATALARSSASTRHLLWLTSLSLLLLVPLVSTLAPSLRVLPLPFALAASAPVPSAGVTVLDGTAAAGEVATVVRLSSAATGPGGAAAPRAGEGGRTLDSSALLSLLLAVWGAGSVLLLGRLALSGVMLRRALHGSTPLEGAEWMAPLYEAADRLDLADVPRLVLSEDAPMPFACGFRRPTVVLPKVAEEWDASRRQAVLFHELAHVRRRDLVGHTVARVVCALYWIHPMVWTAARRLRAESERACDDLALSVGIRASDYADHLLQIVTAVRGGRSPAVALPFADRRELEGRVLAILDPLLHRGRPSAANVGALAALLLCGIAFSALAPAEPSAAATPMAPSTLSLQGRPSPSAMPRPAPEPEPWPAPAGEDEAREELAHLEEPHDADLDAADLEHEMDEEDVAVEQARQTGDINILLNALATDPSPLVRRTAAWSMARFDDPAAAAALSRALLNDRDAEVRETSAWALESDRRGAGVDALVQALARDESDEVRGTAAWALGSMSRPPATVLPALERALADRARDVRQRAAWGIGSIRPKTAPAALYRNALDDPSSDVRRTAAWALSEIRDPAATDALIARLERETEGEVTRPIARALLMTSPRSTPTLDRLLRSPDAEIRASAVAIAAGARAPAWHWPWPWPWPRPSP